MFEFLWTRASSSAAASQASGDVTSHQSTHAATHDPMLTMLQDSDWVLLPADYDDMMSQSVSNLDLVSASTMLPHSCQDASTTTATAAAAAATTATSTDKATQKSRRQLKYEHRKRLAQEEAERTPRYDPHMARLRDHEFKMAKMGRLSLRSGRIMSSSNSGLGGGKTSSLRSGSASAQQKVC